MTARSLVKLVACVALVQLFSAGCGGGGSGGASNPSQASPQLLGAQAMSNHYVQVTFDGDVDIDAMQANRYQITGPGGTLPVQEARVGDSPSQVILTTGAQDPVTYQLTYAAQSAAVTGSSQSEAQLLSAIALSNTSVLLNFSEAMGDGATTIGNYRIVARDNEQPPNDIGDIDVLAASLSADKLTVTLTTSPQVDLEYEVKVVNVHPKSSPNQLIDPTANAATFFGMNPVDTTAPRVLSCTATSATMVLVAFSEPLVDDSADFHVADPLNFAIAPDVAITTAMLNEFRTQVQLTTLPLVEGISYTLSVSNIVDPAGNALDPSASSCSFTFQGQSGLDEKQLPRVAGAASTGNTGVVVQFSKPMGDSVLVASSYVIVQTNQQPEAGALLVTGASFTGGDRLSVQLTTRSQNELTYTLTVVNVKDLAGNTLAPRQLVAGVIIDPTSATFPGTPPTCGPLMCSNGHGGIGGTGACSSDDDCTDDGACGSDDVPSCRGACTPNPPCTSADADGDGLTDNEEQRGWTVTVVLANGEVRRRDVTSDPDSPDTDNDGLSDALEKNIGTDPRDRDTDDDGLSDDEEYNVLFSDPTMQDSDGDGISDQLEVEFFKTNVLVADSDGDGYDDGQELFEMNRDPRISDLPQFDIQVGSSRLQIDEHFTFNDATGQTQNEDSNTTTSLQSSSHRQRVSSKNWNFHFTGGIEDCQTDNACNMSDAPIGILWSFFSRLKLETGFDRLIQTEETSAEDAQRAYQQSLTKGRQLSNGQAVTRDLSGARMDVELTLDNRSDVAFTLDNLEVTVEATDPNDPASFLPIGTLVPGSTLQTGNPAAFNIGPGESRGPIIFSTKDVFPNLVEDLMRNPRGLVFRVANYDLTTSDGRNFAFGLQTIRERTVGVTIDFGDGTVREYHAITAGVLNRDRSELRCSAGGDHPNARCQSDADCGSSTPCEGGKIVGGFSRFGGTGRPPGVPLDFVLQDILHMRKTTPPVLVAGPNGQADTTALGDDVQAQPVGTAGLDENAVVVAPGRNGILDTVPEGDDYNPEMPDGILAGHNGTVQSVAQGDDIQLVPLGTTGVPEETVVISAGQNGILDTTPLGDDVTDVVTGYEVSKSCDAATPSAILAGANGVAETEAEDGICTVALPPHFIGESCKTNLDCGDTFLDAPSDTVAAAAHIGDQIVVLNDASPFPGAGPVQVGEYEIQYSSKSGNTLQLAAPLMFAIVPDTEVTLVTPRCDADVQVQARGTSDLNRDAVVIQPGTASFLVSVPSGDDVPVSPGIPCTQDDDCHVAGMTGGACDGAELVVRVDNRRRGQYRRFWALILPDQSQYQTDFGRIDVRAGDQIGLAFIQDVDRDGLSAEEEFLRGSSDFRKDTDGDQIGDFSEVRLGWTVGVVGQPLRRVFSDPRRVDSDNDGLTDREEQDLRWDQCACFAEGPKSLLGSGSLLRGEDPANETGGLPCRSDDDCGGTAGSCRDAAHCGAAEYDAHECRPCSADVTLNRTDPLRADTDGDGVSDFDEVFGYRTGAGIVDAASPSGQGVILAGPDREAATTACPSNYCVERPDIHCMTGGDCLSRQCIHPIACDEVQVVTPGSGVTDQRTVVVAPGPIGGLSSLPSGDDVLLSSGDGIASSHARGDDDSVVGIGQAVTDQNGQCVDGSLFDAMNRPERFDLCRIAMPGLDGVIQSLPGGDDVIVPGGAGQKLEVSDPLSPDTDMDGLQDGLERVRGSSPNDPTDTQITGDSDQDGLTDNIEDSGWAVTWTDPNGQHTVANVPSNPFVADTDFDGLPDYAERHMPCHTNPTCDGGVCSNDAGVSCSTADDCVPECPTDPTRADTDRDGISDYDELSAEQFALLARYNDFFSGYFIDGTDSKMYGTDPNNYDTDGDGLSDHFELFTGWTVVRTDGTVVQVFSDPTKSDTDGDGLADADERTSRTDPGEPDTDSDGRTDGQEARVGSNPLLPDVTVSLTYSYMDAGGHFDGEGDRADWVWSFYAQHSSKQFPGDLLSDASSGCVPAADAIGQFIYFPLCRTCQSSGYDFNLNNRGRATRTYNLSPGDAVVLNGWIINVDNCPTTGGIQDPNCRLSFVDTPLRYEDVQDKSFLLKAFPMSGGGCSANVYVEVQVNCAGTARNLCQFGTPCVFDEDCASGLCSDNRCAANCGNGIAEGEESCDDGNKDACGTCDASCSAAGTGATCEVGIGCAANADCLSGSCFDGKCVAVCGNGIQEGTEACDDGNASSCGTCDAVCGRTGDGATCPIGTGCKSNADCLRGACSDGVCVPVCGDGFVDEGVSEGVVVPSETCDDKNDLACGTCNATCSGAGTGATCLGGTGCKSGADCASGLCSGGLCTATCGNGLIESGETCEDNNPLACGTCNASCNGAGTGATCPVGTGCSVNGDCESGSCSGGVCVAVCGNGILESGETCDDGNTLACGACNGSCNGAGTGATCAVGTGCSVDGDCESGSCSAGLCVAVCGNGIVEGSESCDDANALACGTCNATCSGAGTGATCPVDTSCLVNDDCESGSCSGGLCVAVCGNGIVEGSESCDDNNVAACGSCNATCSGAGTGADCPAGTSCASDDDCEFSCDSAACTAS